jgi:hypothetical protein
MNCTTPPPQNLLKTARGKRYPLAVILSVMPLGKLSGETDLLDAFSAPISTMPLPCSFDFATAL